MCSVLHRYAYFGIYFMLPTTYFDFLIKMMHTILF